MGLVRFWWFTIISVRRGPKVIDFEELRKPDLAKTTGVVLNSAKEHKVRNINVDEVGVGAGVLDNLKQDRSFNAKGINGGMRADNAEKYLNLRAQLFDGLRQRFAHGDISIPDDPELISVGIHHIQVQRQGTAATRIQRRHQIPRQTKSRQSRRTRIRLRRHRQNQTTIRRKSIHSRHHRKTPSSQDVGPQMARLTTTPPLRGGNDIPSDTRRELSVALSMCFFCEYRFQRTVFSR